ncbi:tyrosine--tRNA ligase, chloroplastic/mitochondrial-like, partial [Fagus crenata]
LKPSIKVYCGFDPTAQSLHLGNLLGLVVLSWFHRYGHTPVALIGSATAHLDTLCRNTLGIHTIITNILSSNSDSDSVVLNNYD